MLALNVRLEYYVQILLQNKSCLKSHLDKIYKILNTYIININSLFIEYNYEYNKEVIY